MGNSSLSSHKRSHLQVIANKDGSVTIKSPPYRGLSLSGGGTKGISYSGLLQAMTERDMLREITEVSGASAGAMAASLIALGVPSSDFEKLMLAFNPLSLLDKPTPFHRAKGVRFKNMLDLIFMAQIKQYLDFLDESKLPAESKVNYERLKAKIARYESALEVKGLGISNMGDIVALLESPESLKKVDNLFISSTFPESEHFTLEDLPRLRALLPKDRQHLIKNLTVAITNQTTNQVELYASNSAETAAQPMAQVVQWSGAHPFLFSPGKNAKGQNVADGGILDNMPSIPNLDSELVLHVKTETQAKYRDRFKKADRVHRERLSSFERALDYMCKKIFGGRYLQATASLLNREKVLFRHDNMLYINTGNIRTTSITPTLWEKKRAIRNGYHQTQNMINGLEKKITSPLLALLYLGQEQLQKILITENTHPLRAFALHAQAITIMQQHMVNELNAGQYTNIELYINNVLDILSTASVSLSDRKSILTLCLKQVNFQSEGKLLNHLTQDLKTKRAPSKSVVQWLQSILTPVRRALSSEQRFSPKTIEEDFKSALHAEKRDRDDLLSHAVTNLVLSSAR